MKKRILFHKSHFLFSIPTLLFFSFLLFAGSQAFGVTKTSTGGTWNTAGNWSPAGVPIAGDDVIINTAMTLDINTVSLNSLTVNTTRSLTLAGFNITVTGTTNISGSLTDNTNAGSNRFDGMVTINSGGVFSTTNNSPYEFRGGITNDGTCSLAGTGVKTFSTNSQTLAGAAAISLGVVTINASITITNNNTGTTTLNGTTTINGTLADGNDGGSNVFSGAVTIAAGGTLSTSNNSNYSFAGGIATAGTFNLTGTGTITLSATQTISGSGNILIPNLTISAGTTTWSNTGTLTNTGTSSLSGSLTITAVAGGLKRFDGLVTIAAGTFSVSNTAPMEFRGGIDATGIFNQTGAGALSFTTNNQTISGAGATTFHNLSISSGITITNSNTAAFTVTTTSTINGPLAFSGATGLKLFTGLPTISGTGSLTSSGNAPFEFRAGITNNGTFSISGTGVTTFSTTASQTIQGNALTFGPVTVNTGITVSTSGTIPVTINGNLVLTGSINFTGAGTTTLNSSTCSGAGNATVQNLVLTGTTISQTGTFTVLGTTNSTGASPITATGGLKQFRGLVTVTSGTFSVSGNAPLEFRSGITNNGTFTITGTGGSTFSTNSQVLQGNLCTFNAVTVNTGITLSTTGAVPVTFNGNLIATGTLDFTGAGTTTFGAVTASGVGNITVQTLSLNGTTISQTGTFTVLGTTNSTGTSPITATGGLKQFRGLVTVTSGTMSSSSTAPLEFQAGILATGVFNQSGTGIVAFTGAQTISGAGTVTFTGAATASASLTLDKSAGAITFGSTLTVANDLTLSTASSATVTGVGLISGNLIINSGSTLSPVGNNFTVIGTTDITGSFTDATAAGLNRFDGLVTLNIGGSFTNSSNPAYEFRGGITNNGTFAITGSGLTTFSTNNQVIQGNALSFGATTVATGITVSSSGAVPVTFNGNLTTTGNIDFTGAGLTSLGNFTVSGAGNITLQSLAMTLTTTIIQTGTFTVLGTTSSTGTTISAVAGGLKRFDGLVTVSSGIFSVSSTAPLEFGGGIIATGTFNQSGAGAVTFTGAQTISGTGAVTFTGAATASSDLTLSKTAGTVTFNGALSTAGNLSLLSTTACAIAAGSAISGNLSTAAGTTFTLSGTAATIVTGTSTIDGTMTCGTTGTVTLGGAIALSGSLNLSTSNFIASSTTTLTGTASLTDNSTTGANNLFAGLVTVGAGCTFNNTGNIPAYEFRGGITNNGTFAITGTGLTTFSTNNQVIQGNALSFGATTVATGITVSSSGAVPVTFNGNLTTTGNIDFTGAGLTTLGNFTVSGAANITLQSLTMAATTTITQTGTFTVLGTTNTAGTIISAVSGGVKRFDGLVTNSGTFTINNTAPLEFRGGITTTGAFNQSGAGAVAFTGAQTISGAGAVTFTGAATASSDLTFSKTAGTVTFNGALSTAGNLSLLQSTNCAVVAGVSVSGTLSSVSGTTLNTSGTANTSVTGTSTIGGTMTCGTTGSTTLTGAITITGTLNTNNSAFTAGSTLDLLGTGIFSDNANGGSNIFTGQVTVGAGCSFSSANSSPFDFRNGITHNGTTFSLTAPTVTFSTNNQALNGTSPYTINTISIANISLTNNGTLTIANSCNGTTGGSNLTNGANANLTYTAGGSFIPTGSLTANAGGNTVTYSAAAAQNIRSTSGYFNLNTGGNNTRTIFQNLVVSGDLTVANGTTFQGSTFDVTTNNLNIAGTFSKSGTGAILVSGLTTLSGTGTISGITLNPTWEFRNGITQNSSGASNLSTGTTLFSTNNQAINGSGAGAITFGGNVLIGDGITVTNSKSTIITGNLDGTTGGEQWTNANGAALTYAGTNTPFSTTGSLDASAATNIVTYNGTTQTILSTTYHNLTISGTNVVKTIGDFTVNGDFIQTTGTLTSTVPSTQIFASTTSPSIVSVSNGSFYNMTVNKSGAILNLNSTTLNVANNLTINAGSLTYNTGAARTITVTANLSGLGSINMSANAGNVLTLNGSTNAISGFTTVAGNTVNYNRAGDQTVFASANYRTLNFGGSGTKLLTGNTTVSDTMRLTVPLLVSLGSANLTLNAGGRIKAGTLNTNGTFSVNQMIVTNGSGSLIINGNSAAQLTGFSWSSASKISGVFPLGSIGFYSPATISGLSATVAGTGSISMKAVPIKQPNVPYYNNALVKYWDIVSTNLSAITANISFTFNAGEVIGSIGSYAPRVWDGSTLAPVSGPSAPGSNPFSTTGTTFLTGAWTAIDPTVRNAFYSYVTGDWNTPGTWTTDPSGTTSINGAVPGLGDQVFILNGRTVTNSAAGLFTGSLDIENGAVLDLGPTTGHSFGPISGSGLLRQSTVTLPTANFTDFTSSSGGTFEYYDLPSGANILSSALASYNNLLITNSTGTTYDVVLDHNLTINGNLSTSKTGAGLANFVLGNSTTARTLNILRNLTVGTGNSFQIGVFNANHTLNISGNVTNSGTLNLNNTAINYANPTTGAATINFLGAAANTTLTCNSGSTTKFYSFNVQKNIGFELFVTAAAGASPSFVANNKTFDVVSGTLRLGANVTVADMGDIGGNHDLGSSTEIPTLWVDGANVNFLRSNSIVLYGTLRVSAGSVTTTAGSAGTITIRETGQLILEGGTINAKMLRTSNIAGIHRGSYVQSGGTFNLDNIVGAWQSDYSVFSLPYPDNVFKMSGGNINITRSVAGGTTLNGGIMIASSPSNYEVTGGNINITQTPSAAFNFDISSTAPFYNLNISKSGAGSGSVRLNSINWGFGTIAAQPLVVLNNFTINSANAPIFDAMISDVRVKGNLTVNSGGTFQSTTNTLTFDGSSAQTFTAATGTLGSGLSSLTINKSSSTLTLAGTISPVTVRGNLTISNGTLDDGGKTINVAGNIVNNATHSGAGKIALNSSTASQTISGTLNSIFGNLDFSNTNGAAGSTQITVLSNLDIKGNLGLTTDRIANIGNKQIILTGTSAITGTFSNNRHIKTNGLRSDGGIKKTYSSTAAVTFPLGYGTNYAPATIEFSATPTTWGALTVRPAGTKQLYVTDPNCFDLYWKVETSGFTGVPANSVNHTFNYGNLTDDVTYIPAFYDQMAIAYTPINDVTKVNEATNDISFTGVSYTDGDYTAGNPAAFGIVTPYYSRANGDWNTPSTWSNVAFGGAASASIPLSNSPVLIGDGGSFNHTVTVTTNGTISGSLVVDAGSTLDCQTTTGNNFGAIPYATAGGSGKIRISSASVSSVFPAGDFGLFFQSTGGLCEYYSTGSQDFTIPSVTDAPNAISIDTYKNLLINPGAGRTITMPDKNLQIFNNLEVNGSSTGKAVLSNLASRNLTIENNLLLTSGQMELGDAFAQTVYVKGNATIASAGGIQTVNTGTIVHSLNLDGNLFNEGSISFNNASKATLTFQGTGSKVFNGANASASVTLSGLVVNIGTSNATELNITTLGSFSAPSNNWLTLTNGMLKWSKSATITVTNVASNNFTIPATSGLTVNNAGANIKIADVNNDGNLFLAGKLSIVAGSVNVGNSAFNFSNDIEYSSAGIPEIEVLSGATLNVNGHIRRTTSTQLGSLKYTQAGTCTTTVRGKSGNANLTRAKFEILNPGSEFNMSGNSVLIIDRAGAASGVFGDIYLEPASYAITGGEIRVGTTSTSAAMNFDANFSCPLWNLTVDGTTTAKSLTLQNDPIVLQKNLRIEGNSFFSANGLNVTITGDLVNLNPLSTAGLAAGGYRPFNSSQITTFNSSTANQNITGTAGNLTNFAVLNIQNTFLGGQVVLGTNSNVQVSGQLNLTTGTFNTGANLCTTLLNVVNNSAHTSTGTGFLVFGGSVSQSIESGSTANFGSIRISNSAGVVAESPVTLSGNLNIANGIFYINNNLLSLGASSAVTGTFSSSNMIRVNGVTSDAGVTKSYPAGAHDFTFPIGVTLKYTPVRFNVTSNTVAGTITLKSVDTWHPATTDPADKELEYYWRVSSTGFNGSTVVTHTYFYDPLDVRGNEASYVTGRFLTSTWAPNAGIASTVDAINHKSTLTGVNYFDGDFTVGETTEFGTLSTFYSRNATLGGNWDDPNSWSTDATLQHAGAAAFTFPNFNQAVIAAGHTIDVTGNTRNAVSVVVNGTLNLGNTIAHNFGTVSGTGRIQQTATATNQYLFPGGDYSAFITSSGGTFEFGGTTNGTISTQSTYNNVELTGSATKNLPNANITVNGNLTISQGVLTNPNNKNVSLMGNWVNTVGVGGFSSGIGTVNLNGGSQTLTGSTNFYNLVANGAGIKTLTSSLTVTNQLTLSSGVFSTGANQMIVNSTAAISGGSATSYISGNLSRGIPASATTTVFQIGDATAYTPVTINYAGTTIAGGFITANTSSGDHPQVYTSGIDQTKSANRNWSLTNSGVTGFTGYNADFTFIGSDLDVSANPLNFMIAQYSSSAWTQPTVGSITSTSTQGISISGTTFGDFQLGQSVGGKIWIGTTNSNWNLASNWIPASVPGAGDKAIIGSVANQPTFISGGNGQCNDLVLLTGALVTIPTGYTLTVNNDLNAASNTINGNGVLAINGASSTLSGSLTTNANLLVNSGSTLVLGSGSSLNIGGDITVNGSLTPNSLPVTFVGLNNSTVSGNMGFYNLVVNKTTSSQNVILGSDITVSNQLNLLSGGVELNGFKLDLGSTGNLINETEFNRVTGLSGGTIEAIRNLNAPFNVDVAGLGAILFSSANLGSTQVIRKHTQIVFGTGFGLNRRYEIHPTNNSSLNAKLVFNYFDDELVTASGTINEPELDLWRFNGVNWEVQNAVLDDIGNTITKTGIPQFSEWTGASELNNPLDINLAFFSLNCKGKSGTEFIWKTLREKDSKTFTLEASANGKNWESIATTNAAGNSGEERDYKIMLPKIPSGFNQVRLTMMDGTGKKNIFNSLPLNCNSELQVFNPTVYPNPGNGDFTLDLSGLTEMVYLSVLNILGQEVAGQLNNGSRNQKVKLDLRGYPAGIYRLQISSLGEAEVPVTKSINLVIK